MNVVDDFIAAHPGTWASRAFFILSLTYVGWKAGARLLGPFILPSLTTHLGRDGDVSPTEIRQTADILGGFLAILLCLAQYIYAFALNDGAASAPINVCGARPPTGLAYLQSQVRILITIGVVGGGYAAALAAWRLFKGPPTAPAAVAAKAPAAKAESKKE